MYMTLKSCRKLRRRIGIRKTTSAAVILIIASFTTVLVFFWYHNRTRALSNRLLLRDKLLKSNRYATPKSIKVTNMPMRHVPLNDIYDYTSEDDLSIEYGDRPQKFMVDTPGCQIPIAMVQYDKILPKNEISCGKRAVFLKRHDKDHVRVRIKSKTIKTYLKKSIKYYCCYRFIKRSSRKGHEHTQVEYTNCQVIKDGETIKLITDFINVKCFEYDNLNQTVVIYNDVYAFTKKIDTPERDNRDYKTKYNVLMIGMDSMSLSRFTQTMPRTISFFKDNFWLGFRGYHKIADNTFPNLMAVFTGKNSSAIHELCYNKMDDCNNHMIWSRFKRSGYATAYGEDYLYLPDTFKNGYAFRKPPTDHYLRTFYLHGEIRYFKRNVSIVCTEYAPSGQHLLDYAVDFVSTYRRSSFFGVFWMNSYSHDPKHHPQYADKMFENFFNQLTYTGILENTFVIFFSDHGIRYGKYRMQGESYYDERMPALLMWIPTRFKGDQMSSFRSAVMNQYKLLTPFDLYNTLIAIHGISNFVSNYSEEYSDGCPNCQSTFDVISSNRTCEDVGIHVKWCSCHRLYPLEVHDSEGIKSVLYAVSHVKTLIQNVKTKPCWYCQKIELKTILRIHFYYNRLNLYYVVAFSMTPGKLHFEATVLRSKNKMELVGSVSVIEAYKSSVTCTLSSNDRMYCICRKNDTCVK